MVQTYIDECSRLTDDFLKRRAAVTAAANVVPADSDVTAAVAKKSIASSSNRVDGVTTNNTSAAVVVAAVVHPLRSISRMLAQLQNGEPGHPFLPDDAASQAMSSTALPAVALDLRPAYLADHGAVALFRALSKLPPAPLTPAAAAAAGPGPRASFVITRVCLAGCGVRAQGLDAVMAFLESPAGAHVTALDLSDNEFLAVTAGAALAAQAARGRWPALRRIDLSNTNVPMHSIRRIESALAGVATSP